MSKTYSFTEKNWELTRPGLTDIFFFSEIGDGNLAIPCQA